MVVKYIEEFHLSQFMADLLGIVEWFMSENIDVNWGKSARVEDQKSSLWNVDVCSMEEIKLEAATNKGNDADPQVLTK